MCFPDPGVPWPPVEPRWPGPTASHRRHSRENALFHGQKTAISLKSLDCAERKFLRFMEGNGQSRLLAGSPELLNPSPGIDPAPGFFFAEWGPGEPGAPPPARSLGIRLPSKFEFSARRKQPKPVARRKLQTFASPPGIYSDPEFLACHGSLGEGCRAGIISQ